MSIPDLIFAGDNVSTIGIDAITPDLIDYYYVATGGADTNSGTVEEPFLTLEGARNAIRLITPTKPIEVLVRSGTYRRTSSAVFSPQDSGSKAYPITYKAYPNEIPVFSGSKVVSGTWVDEGSGLYSLTLVGQAMFRTLSVGGAVRTRARWPNEGSEHLMVSYPDSTKVDDWFYFDQTGGLPPSILATEEVELVNYSQYQVYRHLYSRAGTTPADDTVSGDGDEKVYVDVSSPTGPDQSFNAKTHYGRYFWENSLSFLTELGEWFWDSDGEILYYKPMTGEDMATLSVEIGVTENIIDIQGDVGTLSALTESFSAAGFFTSSRTETGVTDGTWGTFYWNKSLIRNDSVDGTTSSFRISMVQKGGDVVLQVRYGSTVLHTTNHVDLNNGSEHSFVVTYDRENELVRIYIDGTERSYDGSQAINVADTITSDPPWIGSQGGLPWSAGAALSYYWDGELRDMAIFSKVLTPAEASTIDSTASCSAPAADLAFRMPMDGNFDVFCDTLAGSERGNLWWSSSLGAAFHSNPTHVTGGGLLFDGVDDEINHRDVPGVFVEYLRFEGLEFTGVDRAAVVTDGWTMEGQSHNQSVLGAIRMKYARQMKIEGCNFHDLEGHGVQILDCQDTEVLSNTLQDIGGEGIAVISDKTRVADDLTGNHQINDNTLTRIGHMLKNGNGIALGYVSSTKCLRNTISYCARGGIKMSSILSMDKGKGGYEFAHNHVSFCSTEVGDMGGIYINGVVSNSSIHDNIIHDMLHIAATHGMRRIGDTATTPDQLRGLYMDEGTGNDGTNTIDGWDVYNNLIYRCSAECMRLHNVWINKFHNNVLVDPLDEGGACLSVSHNGYQDGWNNTTDAAFVFKAVGSTFNNNIFYIRGLGDGAKRFTMRIDVSNTAQNTEIKTGGLYAPIGVYDNNLHWPDSTGYRESAWLPSASTQNNLAWLDTDYGAETNSVAADPLFVDYVGDNFTVRGDSPAIALGFTNF